MDWLCKVLINENFLAFITMARGQRRHLELGYSDQLLWLGLAFLGLTSFFGSAWLGLFFWLGLNFSGV